MADNTTEAANSGITKGDLVVSLPNSDYAYLVGRVLAVDKLGAEEHDTENETDDVHVNFSVKVYSEKREQEIAAAFAGLTGSFRPFDELALDDVIMSPDMLLSIDRIAEKDWSVALESEAEAAAFCRRALADIGKEIGEDGEITGVGANNGPTSEQRKEALTPARAALDEPDANDDPAVAALREKLVNRLHLNMADYFETLQSRDVMALVGMTSEIEAWAGAHYHLTERHNFHPSELNYLLQFKNPLQVAAEEFLWNTALDTRAEVTWNLFDKQEALRGNYERIGSEPSVSPYTNGPDALSLPADEELTARLLARLDDNFAAFKAERLRQFGKEDIFNEAVEIAAVTETYEYFRNEHEFTAGQTELLLRYREPLLILAERGAQEFEDRLYGAVSEAVQDILDGSNAGFPDDYDLAESGAVTPKKTTPRSFREWKEFGREEMKNHPRKPKLEPGHEKRDTEL